MRSRFQTSGLVATITHWEYSVALVSATHSSMSGTRLRILNPAGEAEDGEVGAIVVGFLNGFH